MPRPGSGGHSSVRSSGSHSTSRVSGGHRVGSSSSRPTTSRSNFTSTRSNSVRPTPKPTITKPTPPKPATPKHNTMPHTVVSRPPIPRERPIQRTHQTIIIPSTIHTRHTNNTSHTTHADHYTTPPPTKATNHKTPPKHPWRKSIIAILVIILCMIGITCVLNNKSNIPSSTSQRIKLENSIPFQNDCIIDELNWFENIPNTEKQLQTFYNKTGIQPYIVLKAYDKTLTSDTEKEAYANDWYDKHIDNEDTFLYMYFAEEDTDNDMGYMCYVNGKRVTSIMDSEAVNIFWSYIDDYWYSDYNTDDMFIKTFNNTANRIMQVTTTGFDVIKILILIIGCITILIIVASMIKTKFQRDREKAEETERILRTPLSTSSETDDLAEKYLNEKE